QVDMLVILGGNPVYTAPADLNFADKMGRVPFRVPLSLYEDETAAACHWHLAEAHSLETWGDARAFDGTISVMQPLIAPLYSTHSARELLAAFSDKPGINNYDSVRDRLKTANPSGDFERFWRKTLNDGVVANTAYAPLNVTAKFNAASLPPIPTPN